MAAIAVAIGFAHMTDRVGCSARIVLGKECILCGMTRDFFGMLRGETSFLNPISPYVFAVISLELAWRAWFSFKTASRRLAIADAMVHVVLGVVFMAANFAYLAR